MKTIKTTECKVPAWSLSALVDEDSHIDGDDTHNAEQSCNDDQFLSDLLEAREAWHDFWQ